MQRPREKVGLKREGGEVRSGRVGVKAFQDVVIKEFLCQRKNDHCLKEFTQTLFMEECVIPRPELAGIEYEIVRTGEEDGDYLISYPLLTYRYSQLPDEIRENQEEMISIFRDYCIQLFAMHERGFWHLDVKPQNLMVTESKRGVVIDLGTNCAFNAAPLPLGSWWFQPPEVVEAVAQRNERAGLRFDTIDSYALALSYVCVVLQRTYIWGGYDLEEEAEKHGSLTKAVVYLYSLYHDGRDWTPRFWRHVDMAAQGNEELRRLLRGMLAFNPQDRFTFQDVMQSPLIGEVSFSSHRQEDVPVPCQGEIDLVYGWLSTFPVSLPSGLSANNHKVAAIYILELAKDEGINMGIALRALQVFPAAIRNLPLPEVQAATITTLKMTRDTYASEPDNKIPFDVATIYCADSCSRADLERESKRYINEGFYLYSLGCYHLFHILTLGYNVFGRWDEKEEDTDKLLEADTIRQTWEAIETLSLDDSQKEYLKGCFFLAYFLVYKHDFVPSLNDAFALLRLLDPSYCPELGEDLDFPLDDFVPLTFRSSFWSLAL